MVSIIIPVFNREHLISETLDSIINQSYIHWECILVDDGSTDNTLEVLRKYNSSDKRIKVFQRPENLSKGANSCRNYGYEVANGTYINWFDSDDIMHPDFIKNKVLSFTQDIDCVISKTAFFKKNFQQIFKKETRTNASTNLIEDFVTLKVSWYLPDPMWKKSFLINKKLFSETLLKGQDRDFHIRMLLHKPQLKIIDNYLTFYRKHEETISNRYSESVAKSVFDNLNQRITLFENENLNKNLKYFFLKQQTKNYPYLYKRNGSVKEFLKVFKKLFVFDLRNIFWLVRFFLAIVAFHIFGKGSFLLKN